MSDSKARRLAPATPGTAATDAHKRRKNVGTACLACKTRKLKCTGAPPCANCLKSRLECTLDETADKRRRGALKRKIDQLEDKEDLLFRLVEVLRESNNRRTVPLLNLIRSNASLSEIRYYIEHQLPRSELAQTPELVEVCREVKRQQPCESQTMRRILDAKRLSDIPPFSVPAKPWTSIIIEDAIVSHLVSLWFTWVHPFCNWIDRDLFIRDMKAGSLSASYCSPFLVNIILADACAYSDYPEACGIAGDMSSKGAHFYDEAKRLLDREDGRITLPTVQGLGVMWMCASMTGRERHEWISRGLLAYSVEELARTAPSLLSKTDPESLRMARVINHAHWGLFNLSMIHALSDKKAPVIDQPLRQSPPSPVSVEFDQIEWCPYPDQLKGTNAHTSSFFSALCELNQIVYGLSPYLFSQAHRPQDSLEVVQKSTQVLQQLDEWHKGLPHILNGEKFNAPHFVCLHMYYHSILMTIHGFLRSKPDKKTNLETHTHPSTTSHDMDSPLDSVQMCLISAREIANLTHTYRSRWGFDRIPANNINWIVPTLFTLLDALGDPQNRDAFIALTIATRACSRRWETVKGILQKVQATAHERGLVLPTETDALFIIRDRYSSSSTGVKCETPEGKGG